MSHSRDASRVVRVASLTAAVLAATTMARAQSLNVDFGAAGKPADTYAAAGLAGVWNSIDGTPNVTYPLVGLDGKPTQVTISQYGGTQLLTASDPSVSGDDAALLNDALLTFNAGLETCLFVHGLEPGSYEVLMYAWMPSAPSVKSRVRHDLAAVTKDVGGAWSGAHVEGVTYARHVLTIGADGFMGSHSGIVPAALASNGAALNGFQIRKIVAGADAGAPGSDAGAPGADAGGGSGTDAAAGMDSSGAGGGGSSGAVVAQDDAGGGAGAAPGGDHGGAPAAGPTNASGCSVRPSLGGLDRNEGGGWLLVGLALAALQRRRLNARV